MWEPDEQLVLRSNTKYKKKEGTLFATSRRVAWQQSGSRQLHPAVRYGDIQGNHIGMSQIVSSSREVY